MITHAIKRVPVTGGGKIIGIVSRADIVSAIATGEHVSIRTPIYYLKWVQLGLCIATLTGTALEPKAKVPEAYRILCDACDLSSCRGLDLTTIQNDNYNADVSLGEKK